MKIKKFPDSIMLPKEFKSKGLAFISYAGTLDSGETKMLLKSKVKLPGIKKGDVCELLCFVSCLKGGEIETTEHFRQGVEGKHPCKAKWYVMLKEIPKFLYYRDLFTVVETVH